MPPRTTPRRWSGCASVLAVIVLAGCGPAKQTRPPAAPPQVTVVAAQRSAVPVTVELPGRTTAYLVAQVRARVDGIVQKRVFQEGADVKVNQPLYQIDPAQYRAALNSAAAAQQKAQANLAVTTVQAERYKALLAGNAVSKQDYDNAVAAQQQAAADVASAKAAVALARLNLGYTDVVSPISGRSGVSLVTQGAYVQAGAATLLTTVQQLDPIYVDLNQASVAGLQMRRDVATGKIKLNGQNQARVTLTLEDGSQYPLGGKLLFTDTTVDPATGSVTVRALFPNPKFVLLPGMFVRARVDEGIDNQALLVPIRAISHDPKGQAIALVVGADNKVAQRTVQTGDMQGDAWVVTGGLKDGERVVVDGVQKVQPGMAVQAVDAPGQAGPAQASAQASK
ncbi:MAG: efflux transporter periplasmic adaptor subunit [Massilia sp.]|nr:efflux transporter periplasmic adaptor subunit [Massilia sp.]